MASAASHPLDGPRGKLVRAKQQAALLSKLCDEYAASEPYRLVCRFEGDAQYVYLEGAPPPSYLGLILGEMIHDLRAALDQLAWQLALDHVGEEVLAEPRAGNAIVFPITSSRENFKAHRALPYFSVEAQRVMEGRQPYHNDGMALVNPLAIVQELSNADKHRGLTPSLGQVRLAELRVRSTVAIDDSMLGFLRPEQSLIDQAEPVLKIPVPESAHIEFEPPAVHVGFLSFAAGVPDVLFHDKLDQLCVQIAEVVIAFEPAFPPVDWSERTKSWITPGMPGL